MNDGACLSIFRAEKNLKNKKEAVRGKWWAEKILKMKKEAVRLDANLLRKSSFICRRN